LSGFGSSNLPTGRIFIYGTTTRNESGSIVLKRGLYNELQIFNSSFSLTLIRVGAKEKLHKPKRFLCYYYGVVKIIILNYDN